MRAFGKRRTFKNFLYSKVTLVVLAGVVVFVGRAAYSVYVKYTAAEEHAREAHRQFAALQEKESFLKDEIARLSTERGVEEEIRKKFRVAKEGEEVVVITDSSKAAPLIAPESERSFWDSINPLNLFRKKNRN